MKSLLLLVYMYICFIGPILAQKGYSQAGISTQIIVAGGLNKLPKPSEVFANNSVFELDLDERFYYQIIIESGLNPSVPLPVSLLLKEVEYIVKFGDEIYGPFVDKNIPSAVDQPTRYSRNCRNLLLPVKKEVLDKINSRNITNLTIYIKFKWFDKNELATTTDANGNKIIVDGIQKALYSFIDKDRVDNFVINVKKFGLIALIDASPLSKEGASLTLDIVNGILKNLSRTSIDYVVTSKQPNFQNVMVSVPFLKYEGRKWFYKNFEAEVILVSDLSDIKKNIAYGVGVGAFGEKDKILKTGMFWIDKKPNYFVGISIRGLATFLSNYK